jgi:hypothetical protein
MDILKNAYIDVETLRNSALDDYHNKRYESWPEFVQEFNRILKEVISSGYKVDIDEIAVVPPGQTGGPTFERVGTDSVIAKIREIINKSERLQKRINSLLGTVYDKKEPLTEIELICSRFHRIVRKLRDRHNDRETLNIEDEYDVQDLMAALLNLFFADIRDEEWTPSYAGGSARMDFLLKREQIVIEIKKTRRSLSDKDIGEQLIIDIEKYSHHPDCKTLICFIYDPEGLIGNPNGLEDDLIKQSNDSLNVIVYIYPK